MAPSPIAVISTREPGRVIGARQGSPLVVGLGDDDRFLASMRAALVAVTRRVAYLDEGDVADIRRESYAIYDAQGQKALRTVIEVPADAGSGASSGPYRHFMQKEIFEQPRAVADTLEGIDSIGPVVRREGRRDPAASRLVFILACGTSYYRASSPSSGSRRSPACRARWRSRASTATATASPHPRALVVVVSHPARRPTRWRR